MQNSKKRFGRVRNLVTVAVVPNMSEATEIFQRIEAGDPTAADGLLPLVYAELRKLAAVRMARETDTQTLQPTALVHEAWLRLTNGDGGRSFANRAHFFSAAAEAMRRILIDRARSRGSQKRGGEWEKIDLDHVDVAADANDDSLLAVNQALEKLAKEDQKAAEVNRDSASAMCIV
jgi:RNA polymerase sigma factor (TIGR02999 family)